LRDYTINIYLIANFTTGGDLVCFKGDYMLAIFKLEDEETAFVLLRAIICGMHLKELLHERELSYGPSKKLQILVSIAGADKEHSKERANVYCGFLGGFQQRYSTYFTYSISDMAH
jgi:hypothetical protein